MWLRPELCVLLLLCCCKSPVVWAAEAPQKQLYSLPSQPLSAALLQFARTTNQPLLYDPALLEGRQAPVLYGEFEPTEALNQLLAQQPLEAIPREKGWLIKAKAVVEQPAMAAAIPASKTQKPPAAMEVIAIRSTVVAEQNAVTKALLPKAKTLKREAMIAQDSLVADDITDFPALNLANSLLRLPGITINREWGEGRQISLRGLGPDFTRVQVLSLIHI